MPTQINEHIFDSTVALNLDLIRLDKNTQAEVIVIIKRMERELIALLSIDNLSDINKARIQQQLAEAKAIINGYYDDIANTTLAATSGVPLITATQTVGALSVATGDLVKGVGILPTTSYMESLVGNVIIEGATQNAWWKRQGADSVWRFNTAVRQGLVVGETNQQIVSRVREAINISTRNATTLVRTSVMSVANETRQNVYENNSDVVKGLFWSATLDARVCPLCAVRDNKEWDLITKKPIGHAIPFSTPPKHMNCRCVMLPRLKTFRELGVDINEVPKGKRASMNSVVDDMDWESFAKRKGDTFLDGVLGRGRAKLYRDKKITFEQLLDSRGNELTLKQLNDKYVN